MDWAKIGLKVGIEIHQQIDTIQKLFCSCPAELSTREPEITFYRRLRPTQSELGEVDPAAAFEFERGRGFLYEADSVTSCLVEMDEEPPHALNEEALDACLIATLLLGSRPVDEVHVMRKVVIDGSNTTGFQRTCIIAVGGRVDVEGKEVPIQTVCLEEDAARKTGEEGLTIRYRLDRLCIPLIEVATAPAIQTPEEAEKAALVIGRVLRATGKVRRGIGTIRQDLNISIRDGALVEVKGVQELDLVSKVVEYEAHRQRTLLGIRDELAKRGATKGILREEFKDVTESFRQTDCRVVKKAIERGGVALAVNLPKFGGLLAVELEPGIRFGTELADYAKFWGRVGGIFHTDELPAYDITEEEVAELRRAVGAGDWDAAVLVADDPVNASDALSAVVKRAREAVDGVPSETRGAYPDGTTHYSRPRPGAARMYPETDIPPVPVTEDRLNRLKASLPEPPEARISKVMGKYGINRKLASQLIDYDYADLFEAIAQQTRVAPSFVAATLTETLRGLRREGVEIWRVSEDQMRGAFALIDSGTVAKESIPGILTWLAKHEGAKPDDAVKALELGMLTRERLEELVDRAVGENMPLIRSRGEAAIGRLMGIVMSEVRGKAAPEEVSRLIRERIARVLKE